MLKIIEKNMKWLFACEESQAGCIAARNAGYEAYSCDVLPCSGGHPEWHIQADAIETIKSRQWDRVISFPPCTHLAVSGARWFKYKKVEQAMAIEFFITIAELSHVTENPIGIMSTLYRKPDQIIQPWQFGHGETKATCLWLNGVPPLVATKIVSGRDARIHRMPPGANRSKERSKSYIGIMEAMVSQWGEKLAD